MSISPWTAAIIAGLTLVGNAAVMYATVLRLDSNTKEHEKRLNDLEKWKAVLDDREDRRGGDGD